MSPSLVVRRVAMVGTAVAVLLGGWAGSALAAGGSSGGSGMVATGGGPVNVRSDASTENEPVGKRANRSKLVFVCRVKGQKVHGFKRTTTYWNKLKGGGYVSDAYVKHIKLPPLCRVVAKESVPVFAESSLPSTKAMHPLTIPANQKLFKPTAEQMRNARAIVAVGQKLELPPRAWVIAVATALQESTLHNYGHLGKRNDHDSLGLFQQRPKMGWGTPEQVTNPEYAATRFYKKLIKQKKWREVALTVAAQRVQISGYPKAYAKWEKQAGEIIRGLYGRGPYAVTGA
jgi:hypothetical protein